MTTNIDHLALIKATIDTQYDLARIELFRPLEIYDRFVKLGPKDMLHACNPTFNSSRPPIDTEERRKQFREIDELVTKAAKSAGAAPWETVFVRHEALCTCGMQGDPLQMVVYRYSFRVSMTWNGRTLTREYLLPEVAK